MTKRKTKASKPPLEEASTLELHQTVVDHFDKIVDPRVDRTKRHKLLDIIFIAISAAICGADNWKAVEIFANAKQKWLESILELPSGIPSHVTFWRVFSMINAEQFQESFNCWVKAAFKPVEGDIIALDGKTMRGSGDKNLEQKPLHIVSAWASEHNITLAQLKVDDKSNEITAIPSLLDMIEFKGAIITTDAMGCQKDIAKTIIDGGGDYILALKGNHGIMHAEIENYFLQALGVEFKGIEYDSFETLEKGHGRIEKRTVYVTSELDWLPKKEQWANLTSIVMVIRERTVRGKTTIEKHFYLSSLEADAKKIGNAIRKHWGIENKVHWILDVTFKEDKNQLSGNGALNFSLLSKIALNLLKQEKTAKLSIPNKRFKASMNDVYLEKVLKIA